MRTKKEALVVFKISGLFKYSLQEFFHRFLSTNFEMKSCYAISVLAFVCAFASLLRSLCPHVFDLCFLLQRSLELWMCILVSLCFVAFRARATKTSCVGVQLFPFLFVFLSVTVSISITCPSIVWVRTDCNTISVKVEEPAEPFAVSRLRDAISRHPCGECILACACSLKFHSPFIFRTSSWHFLRLLQWHSLIARTNSLTVFLTIGMNPSWRLQSCGSIMQGKTRRWESKHNIQQSETVLFSSLLLSLFSFISLFATWLSFLLLSFFSWLTWYCLVCCWCACPLPSFFHSLPSVLYFLFGLSVSDAVLPIKSVTAWRRRPSPSTASASTKHTVWSDGG